MKNFVKALLISGMIAALANIAGAYAAESEGKKCESTQPAPSVQEFKVLPSEDQGSSPDKSAKADAAKNNKAPAAQSQDE